ncbi:LLM class flavin-dependent oxidoreductase [Nakamurella aerolata]|nr:LLM class flavin-dependent oxidoreductase [Nakamurella aerolata]
MTTEPTAPTAPATASTDNDGARAPQVAPGADFTVGMCFDRSFPAAAVTEFAHRLEAGGVDELWLIEDCFYTTAPPLAAAALAVTDRLSVGLGILPAVARTPAITAMEIATLAGLGPGRVIGGIGHGVQSWMRQMGAETASPVTTLDEVIGAVRRLLAGETVTVDGREVHLTDVRLEHAPQPIPPVVAGVRGPRSLRHAGRFADGVLLDAPCPPSYVDWAKDQCRRSPDDFQYRCFATMCIVPDRTEAYRISAGFLTEMLDQHHPGLAALPFHDELVELGKRGEDALAGMPADWWGQIGAIGTLDDAVAYVEQLRDRGIRGVSMFPAPDLEIARGQIDDVIALRRALT